MEDSSLHEIQHKFLREMSTEDLHAWARKLRDANRAFHLHEQLHKGVFCVIRGDWEWLAQWKRDEGFADDPHDTFGIDFVAPDPTDDNRRMLGHIDMEIGVRIRWWEDWDQAGPIDFPKTFTMRQFGDTPLMAHIVHALGIFPSLTQARKNGFDQPLTVGDHVFTKRKIRARVVP